MKPTQGFTLIELMVVVAIISLLATMAVPSYQDRVIRAQVGEGLVLAEFAKQSVQAYYARTHQLPAGNEAAGLPPSDRIVGTHVSGLSVNDGAITITFGNQANRHLASHKLTLRPAVVTDYPQVPIAWVCGTAEVPGKMKAAGADATDLPPPHLPLDCRASGLPAK